MPDKEIKFYLEKDAGHREIPVDGAFGGISPTGEKLALTVYTERAAIPNEVVHTLTENGQLGDEVEGSRVGKSGVIRVLQATLHMDLEQSKSMVTWLQGAISELEEAKKKVDAIKADLK